MTPGRDAPDVEASAVGSMCSRCFGSGVVRELTHRG